MPAPVLRSQSFVWSSADGVIPSQLRAVANGFAAGWLQDDASATDAALLPLPEWPTSLQTDLPLPLDSPYRIPEELFADLASEIGWAAGAINLAATAIAVDPADGDPLLALRLTDATDPQFARHNPGSLLLPLQSVQSLAAPSAVERLPSASVDEWVSLLPDEQVNAVLRLPPSDTQLASWLVLGSSLSDGAVATAYRYDQARQTLNYAWPQQRIAGQGQQVDLRSGTFDAALNPDAAGDGEPAVVLASIATAPTHNGLVPEGEQDVLLTGHGESGELLWSALFGNASGELDPKLAVDASGNVFLGSTIQGDLPGALNSAASSDVGIGLAKLTDDGNLLWQRRLGDDLNGTQAITDLLVLSDGTLLVLGVTTSSDGSGLHGQGPLGNGADVDSFLTAYTPAGDRLWSHQFGSTGDDWARAMAILPVNDAGTGNTIDTLVVVGDQQLGASPQAWVELLELADSASIDAEYLVPSVPELNFTSAGIDPLTGLPRVMVQAIDELGTHRLQFFGQADPGDDVRLSTSLAQGNAVTTADPVTGDWSITLELPNLNPTGLGSGLVLAESINAQPQVPDDSTSRLVSDARLEQVEFVASGTGLPDGNPQLLPIDPDGVGSESAVLLQRRFRIPTTGRITQAGDRLLVDYTGRLDDGSIFDSSLNPGRNPFSLTLGEGRVIQGWDQGLQGVPVGSAVELVIPSELGYGENGSGDAIPPDATLTFDVDVRVNLSEAEAFLSQFVWTFGLPGTYASYAEELVDYYRQRDPLYPAYLNAGLGSVREAGYTDLLDFALLNGAGDGTSLSDSSVLSDDDPRLDSFPSLTTPLDDALRPRLALTSSGDDNLLSLGQSGFLYGEGGDDSLTSLNAYYAVLDGGSGDDVLLPTSVLTLVRGGPGNDELQLPAPPSGQSWSAADPVVVGGNSYGVFVRQGEGSTPGDFDTYQIVLYAFDLEGSAQIAQVIPLNVAALAADDLDGALANAWLPLSLSPGTLLTGTATELLNLNGAAQNGDLQGLAQSRLIVSDQVLNGSSLQDLLNLDVALIDASAVSSLEVTLEQATELLPRSDSSDLDLNAALEWRLADSILDAQIVMDLLDASSAWSIDATQSSSVVGPSELISQLLDHPRLDLSQEIISELTSVVAIDEVLSIGRVYSPGEQIDLQLNFSAPVVWNGDTETSAPFIRLKAQQADDQTFEATAAWLEPSSDDGYASNHQFNFIVPQNIEPSSDLQVDVVLGDGTFVDRLGRFVVTTSSEIPSMRNAPDLASVSWSLDVDADGQVGAFSDGLMVIRHLLGSAFSGDRLIDKALSPGATRRSAAEIADYIQVGVDQGFLDFDRDGTVGPFSDGLMLIRQLLGSSFSGTALIDKALSPESSLIPPASSYESLTAAERSFVADAVGSLVDALK
jgi:hypothetical protein